MHLSPCLEQLHRTPRIHTGNLPARMCKAKATRDSKKYEDGTRETNLHNTYAGTLATLCVMDKGKQPLTPQERVEKYSRNIKRKAWMMMIMISRETSPPKTPKIHLNIREFVFIRLHPITYHITAQCFLYFPLVLNSHGIRGYPCEEWGAVL